MAKRFSELQYIQGNETITEETHYEFLFQLQTALLLALREQGRLSAAQYRHAAEKLNSQRRERVKKCLQEKQTP